MIPKRFLRKLKELDKRLDVRWNPRSGCYAVFEVHKVWVNAGVVDGIGRLSVLGEVPIHVMDIARNGEPMPMDDWVIQYLRSIDMRAHRSPEAFLDSIDARNEKRKQDFQKRKQDELDAIDSYYGRALTSAAGKTLDSDYQRRWT